MYFNRYILLDKPICVSDSITIPFNHLLLPSVLSRFSESNCFELPLRITLEDNLFKLVLHHDAEIPDSLCEFKDQLVDTHFLMYRETRRFIPDDRVWEVACIDGRIDVREHRLIDEIEHLRWVSLDNQGYLQTCDVTYEWLISRKDLWNTHVTDYLITESFQKLDVGIQELERVSQSFYLRGEIYYGLSFSLNRIVHNIRVLGREAPPDRLLTLSYWQERDREILFEGVAKLGIHHNNVISGSVSTKQATLTQLLKRFDNTELFEKLGIISNASEPTHLPGNIPNSFEPLTNINQNTVFFLDANLDNYPVIRVRATEGRYTFDKVADSFEEWLNNRIHQIFPDALR